MKAESIKTPNAPSPAGAYSQAVRVGELVFTAQIGPFDPKTNELAAPGNMAEQTRKTLENIEAVLQAAGSALEKAVKVTAYIDGSQWKEFNEAYAAFFGDVAVLPARSIVERPASGGKMVSMEAIAYI